MRDWQVDFDRRRHRLRRLLFGRASTQVSKPSSYQQNVNWLSPFNDVKWFDFREKSSTRVWINTKYLLSVLQGTPIRAPFEGWSRLVRLEKRSPTSALSYMENANRLVNYVRAHRKRAGLSQRELALILGYRNEGVVSRHELFRSLPPLLVAIGYEVVFQTSVSDLFPGLRETVESAIDGSLTEFENALCKQREQAKGSQLPVITRKLEWLDERRSHSGTDR